MLRELREHNKGLKLPQTADPIRQNTLTVGRGRMRGTRRIRWTDAAHGQISTASMTSTDGRSSLNPRERVGSPVGGNTRPGSTEGSTIDLAWREGRTDGPRTFIPLTPWPGTGGRLHARTVPCSRPRTTGIKERMKRQIPYGAPEDSQ